jgi:transposase
MARQFNKDFKESLVKLYNNGTPVSQLAKDYDVGQASIHKWIKEAKGQVLKEYTVEDIEALEKRALKAEQEVDILKKALTIFGRQTR